MAGVARPGTRTPAPGSTSYNPFTGSYVNPQTGYFGRTAETAGQAPQERAAATVPMSVTDPLGRVDKFNYETGAWDLGGYIPPGGTPGTSPSTRGGRGGVDQNALNALLAEIRGAGSATRIQPSATTAREGDPYDRTSEAATYGAAKERTGLAMQAAMKGLQGSMAGRGIRGSTIHGDALGGVYEAGLGELAGTDRQLAEKFADRSFTAENIDLSREESGRQFNDSFRQGEEGRVQQAAMSQLDRILRAYGMFY